MLFFCVLSILMWNIVFSDFPYITSSQDKMIELVLSENTQWKEVSRKCAYENTFSEYIPCDQLTTNWTERINISSFRNIKDDIEIVWLMDSALEKLISSTNKFEWKILEKTDTEAICECTLHEPYQDLIPSYQIVKIILDGTKCHTITYLSRCSKINTHKRDTWLSTFKNNATLVEERNNQDRNTLRLINQTEDVSCLHNAFTGWDLQSFNNNYEENIFMQFYSKFDKERAPSVVVISKESKQTVQDKLSSVTAQIKGIAKNGFKEEFINSVEDHASYFFTAKIDNQNVLYIGRILMSDNHTYSLLIVHPSSEVFSEKEKKHWIQIINSIDPHSLKSYVCKVQNMKENE